MKIDIHVHTKKIKSGDSLLRNIEIDRFLDVIKTTDVKIFAITNHNHFDLEQYDLFVSKTIGDCQIWPGIELDILENKNRGHLIVIVNPNNSKKFFQKIQSLLKGKSEEDFTINIKDLVKNFDSLDPIYIPHYYGKKPNISDEDIETLIAEVSNQKRILKEATNSVSAGIYISHGHNSIYGSDIQDWNKYSSISKTLPDLRLPVESYEQFCLLLERDISTINTILNKKSKEKIKLIPFDDSNDSIELDIFNDINILFGSKGTGKTKILEAISKYYNEKGYQTNLYKSGITLLSDFYDLKGDSYKLNFEELDIDTCSAEILFIKNATEKNITSILDYVYYFSNQETNKISKTIKVKDFARLDDTLSTREFNSIQEVLVWLEKTLKYINTSSIIRRISGEKTYEEFVAILTKIINKTKKEYENKYLDFKSIVMFNNLVTTFSKEITRKTGSPQKPVVTGFKNYASNRIKIEINITKILNNINTKIVPKIEEVGNLGGKGILCCQTNLFIQDGDFTNSDFSVLGDITKTSQKKFAKNLRYIFENIYSLSLFEKISSLKPLEDPADIKSIEDLFLFNKHFKLEDQKYVPSTGESAMILLYQELNNDKDIYLIDEPERSLGNDYISDVIVPMLKELARINKKVIIATHDANIAVRTLPYTSIYREHDINCYNTYVGNPFSNSLVCVNNKENSNLDWKFISMKTLEGGKEAFGERGKIYGNI